MSEQSNVRIAHLIAVLEEAIDDADILENLKYELVRLNAGLALNARPKRKQWDNGAEWQKE